MGSRSGGTASLARAVSRRTWMGLLGISVLLGLGGGVVLGTFAIARRTSTADDRLIDATAAFDVLVNPDFGTESALDAEAVRRLPQAADMGRADGIALVDVRSGLPLPITLVSDGVAYERLGRPNVLAGRLPDQGAGDEVFVDREWARNSGITVGDESNVVAIGVTEFGLVESIGFEDARTSVRML